jgi:hypothetical protein
VYGLSGAWDDPMIADELLPSWVRVLISQIIGRDYKNPNLNQFPPGK